MKGAYTTASFCVIIILDSGRRKSKGRACSENCKHIANNRSCVSALYFPALYHSENMSPYLVKKICKKIRLSVEKKFMELSFALKWQ